MLLGAADFDVVRAGTDDIGQRRFRIKLGAELIEVSHFDAAAEFHLPSIGRQLTKDQAQQRSLTGAVGTDQADLVAAQDATGEVAHHVFLGRTGHESLGDVFEFRHQLARGLAAHNTKIDLALLVAPRRTFGTQMLEPGNAADTARASCLDPFADPDFLLRQQLVGAGIRQRLLVEHELLALLICGKAAGETDQLAAIELDNARGHAIEENAIMGDHDDGTGIATQQLFEPENAVDIEMVGRFVEQQQFRLADQRLGQGDALATAAGERVDMGFAIQRQTRDRLFDA